VVGAPALEIVDSIGSTNCELLARLGRGETIGNGHWLVANRQSSGRGRLGRQWLDGFGNFMGSTVIGLMKGDPAAHTLALVAGLAVFDTLALVLSDPRRLMLKWPNDLLLDGAKLAGILLERSGDRVVVGIGINLAQAPEIAGRPVMALADIGVHVARDDVARTLAENFAHVVQRWRRCGLAAIITQWVQRGPAIGTGLRVELPGEGCVTGAYGGLLADGALLLRLENGQLRAIYAGDVALIGAEGEG
jgi:BirA family biotin operon repressor/biotin-[acetyl-CoA-carboxylase] ligase